jgi:glycosidase
LKRKHWFTLIGVVLCIAVIAYYFLNHAQTFAQGEPANKGVKQVEVKPVNLDEIKLSQPMTKQDGMVYYEIFVRSFYDSNGDGIGDLNGVTEKLDYIKSLGVNGIWLMPITDSPSYHGYDVTDYNKVNPQYGTMEDFIKLTDEAHKRGIKVIMDFVINHTSSQHPWFVDASKSENSKYRDYYVWADKDTNLNEMNDQLNRKAWNKTSTGYFYAEFWDGMPDLNFDNKEVREEIKKSAKLWIENGVDGFRIDAAKYIFPQKRTQDTLLWWQEFGDYVRGINKDAYIVGEVWSDEITISRYFKVLNANFDFPVANQIMLSAASGNPDQLIRQMENSYTQYAKVNPDYVDSPFLTNHDQNRVMSELKNINKVKSAAAVYLTLPGNPTMYYGEEIGMLGKKPDEVIREPFKWYAKEGGKGQTTWERMLFNGGKDVLSVEEQDKDSNSLLNFYRDMVNFRQSSPVLSKGDIKIITSVNNVLAYARTYNNESNLIVHNLKGEEVSVEIDLPDGVNISGNVIKGSGEAKVNGKVVSVKLKPNTFVIVK